MSQDETKYIRNNEHTWRVMGSFKSLKKPLGILVDGKCYIGEDDGYVRIFSQYGEPKDSARYPYFWFDENENVVFSEPSKEVMDEFKESNVISSSLDIIVGTTKPDEELLDTQAINDMNAAAAMFIPLIEEKDDFLKRMVKTVIINKEIDISRLKCRLDRPYSLPNMKAALINSTKMSVPYFLQWMEMLGCDFQLAVSDNGGDTINPLKNTLLFNSANGKIEEIHD